MPKAEGEVISSNRRGAPSPWGFYLYIMRVVLSLLLIALSFYRVGAQHSDQSVNIHQPQPEYPGGDTALVKFLQENIIYPQMERDNHIEGTVMVRFIVDETGVVRSPQVKRVSPGLDREAMRVVKTLPRFKPAYSDGHPRPVYVTYPVVFKLSDHTKPAPPR